MGFPVLITLILGSILWSNSVGSNSSGEGWILTINFWFKDKTIFEISSIGTYTLVIEAQSDYVINVVGGIGHVPDSSSYSISMAGFFMLLAGMISVLVLGVILVKERKKKLNWENCPFWQDHLQHFCNYDQIPSFQIVFQNQQNIEHHLNFHFD